MAEEHRPQVLPGKPFDRLSPGWEFKDLVPAPLDPSDPTASNVTTSHEPMKVAHFDSPSIEQSPNDSRSYRLLQLPNGLECLLVSDPETDKAAASVDVNVGHLSDPVDLQGLAHYVEHLSFMGSEKYPKENDYSEFLASHSGSSNAFTAMDSTNYFFDVHPAALSGALSRFSQFFVRPLFLESCCDRELNAIESEHRKNEMSDTWRLFQLDKSTSRRPQDGDERTGYWKFGTGNLKTLKERPEKDGVDVRERLLAWWRRHYSANLMKLAIVGKEPLDQLAALAIRDFADVPNYNYAPPYFGGSPYGPKQLGTTIYAKTVKDMRYLELSFPFPDQRELFRTKPGSFLSHFIGHEGPGSILSHLKNQGWATGLTAGAGSGAPGFEFFKVTVSLTKDGLENHQAVSQAIFKYISLLKSVSPQEWAFREVEKLTSIDFRFKEKTLPSIYVMGLSQAMQLPFPRESVLSGQWLVQDFDPQLITKMLDYLHEDRCRILVASQNEVEVVNEDGKKEKKLWDQKEDWYRTAFAVEKTRNQTALPPSTYQDLALPTPNEFIPSNLEVKGKQKVDDPLKRPLCIRQTPVSRLWHKKDDRWWVPRASVLFLLRCPLIDASANTAVKTRLFTELVRDTLTEYSYDAHLAGLSYGFSSMGDGLILTVDGYNDKLPVLVRRIFEVVRDFKIDPKRFEIIKDDVRRKYQNFALDPPYHHSAFYMTYLTQEKLWTHTERLGELERTNLDDLQNFIPDLLSRLHMEALVHGNVLKDEALNILSIGENALSPSPLTPEELRSPRCLTLPEGTNSVYCVTVPNPRETNSSLEYLCYVGDVMEDALRVRLSLLSQIAAEPVFDQLRTKEQLGYIVASRSSKAIGFMGLRVIIQSDKNAVHLEERVDAFWDWFKDHLVNMSEEEFDQHKTSLINKKLEDDKNMWQEASGYWLNIQSGYYAFFQRTEDAERLKSVTKDEVMEFFMHFIHPSSPARAKLSVHVQSQCFQPSDALVLLDALTKRGVPIKQEAFDDFMLTKPTVAEMATFAQEYLASHAVPESVLAEIMGMVHELGKPRPLPSGASQIDDLKSFKNTLTPGPNSKPVQEYLDFPPHL